jgi:hypothetical protein
VHPLYLINLIPNQNYHLHCWNLTLTEIAAILAAHCTVLIANDGASIPLPIVVPCNITLTLSGVICERKYPTTTKSLFWDTNYYYFPKYQVSTDYLCYNPKYCLFHATIGEIEQAEFKDALWPYKYTCKKSGGSIYNMHLWKYSDYPGILTRV